MTNVPVVAGCASDSVRLSPGARARVMEVHGVSAASRTLALIFVALVIDAA